MLHDDHRQVRLPSDVERGHDVRERLLARRGLDLQDPVEVLLLDVDDDEGSAGRGHEVSLDDGWFLTILAHR